MNAMTPRRALAVGLMVAAVVVVADQLSKWAMVERVMRPEGVAGTPFFGAPIIEVTSFFNLVMTWNRGVSFGLFNNQGAWNAVALSGLSLAVVVLLLLWLRRGGRFP